jgi:hypothetical protein
MNDYQREQLEALEIVRRGLMQIGDTGRRQAVESVRDYLSFRNSVDDFLDTHFKATCTRTCYQDRTSACCSKDGIIVFFADVVINALHASTPQLDALAAVLKRVNRGHRCVYLQKHGCMWAVRPVVCAMFLCDRAMATVFANDPAAAAVWSSLRRKARLYKWPDRPVLFDELETAFIDLGHRSSLMHLHFSPGLLNVKRRAGLID